MNVATLISRAELQEAVAPLTESEIVVAETQLGFALPPLLRTIYGEVADGGFGPGHGLLGLMQGSDELPESVVGLYNHLRNRTTDDPAFVWPEKLLPVLDWGCSIRTCVDCSQPSLPVIRFDPYEKENTFSRENFDFDPWLQAWMDGFDHWTGKPG